MKQRFKYKNEIIKVSEGLVGRLLYNLREGKDFLTMVQDPEKTKDW